MPTDTACTAAVAMVMPSRIATARKRVAKASAISWLLSPISATKMAPKATTVPPRTRSPCLLETGRGAGATTARQ